MGRRERRAISAITGATCLVLLIGVDAPPARSQTEPADPTAKSLPLDSAKIDSTIEAAPRSAGTSRLHLQLRFDGRLSMEQRERLARLEIDVLEYSGGGIYLVTLDRQHVAELRELPGLLHAGRRLVGEKLDSRLAEPPIAPQTEPQIAPRTPPVEPESFIVEFYEDVPPERARQLLPSDTSTRRFGSRTWIVHGTRARMNALAELDEVLFVQLGPSPPVSHLRSSRRLTSANEAQQGVFRGLVPTYRADGSGARLGICDTGLDRTHPDFFEITEQGAPGRSRVYGPSRSFSPAVYHGTIVASIAGGSGVDSANHLFPAFRLRGVAPFAELGDYPQFGADAAWFAYVILEERTDVTNHSYEGALGYNSESRQIDRIVRGDELTIVTGERIPPRPQVWAIGNQGDSRGYFSTTSHAKNTITVGALSSADGSLWKHSGLGPTSDGRIKPDLVAPGCEVWGAWHQGGYSFACGTSMAAPAVTGTIGLMLQAHRSRVNDPGASLLPSTYKAMLVHTAKDQVKLRALDDRGPLNTDTSEPVNYHAGPDFATGWGLLDADRARDITTRSERWKEKSLQSTNETQEWCIDMPAGSPEIKVTIAWDDLPGGATQDSDTTARLVNDLDLELVPPPSSSAPSPVLPWTIPSPPPFGTKFSWERIEPAARARDSLNNVEMATWPHPKSGPWKIRVVARALEAPQSYSLVSSHRIEDCP